MFFQLVWAVLLGVVVFDEPIDPFVVLGEVIVLGSVTFISWCEAAVKRQFRIPPVLETKT